MRYLLGLDRMMFFLKRRDPMPEHLIPDYEEMIDRRLRHDSVAYIVGEREFLGLSFAVGAGALVPRPETELLVEWAVKWLEDFVLQRAVDVGTGSGAIAIALDKLAPPLSLRWVIGIDPSADALRWARRNRRRLRSLSRIAFVRGSLLSCLSAPVDLVLANLPYLTPEQVDENPDLASEPRSALVSGEDGLDLIRALLDDLPRVLSHQGAAILELDPAQAETVAGIARVLFPRAKVTILPDLSGRDRFVTIERWHTGAPRA
jgi:release factor glutamine methyltransferase